MLEGTNTLDIARRASAGRTRVRVEPERRVLSVSARIDICRGLFAYLVVVAHALDVAWAVHPGAGSGLSPRARDLLMHTIGSGIYWVMGFFVISGYCIELSIERLRGAGRFPIGPYLVARLTRILPLYYLALLFTALVESRMGIFRPRYWFHGLDRGTFLHQVLCIQNLTETYGSFASSWSITNELFYYVFYGALAWAIAGRRRARAWVGMGLCVATMSAMLALHLAGRGTRVTQSTGLLFGLGINWFLGVLLAQYGGALARSRSFRVLARGWPLVLALGVAMRCDHRLPVQWMYLVSGAAFALLMLRFLVAAGDTDPRERPSSPSPAFELVGLSSYPTYLFHGPTIMLLGASVQRWGLIHDWRLTWLLLVACSLIVGLGLGWFVERPIMAWRGALLKRLRPGRTNNG